MLMDRLTKIVIFTFFLILTGYMHLMHAAMLEEKKEIVSAGTYECMYKTVTPEGMRHFCAIKTIGDRVWQLIHAEFAKNCCKAVIDDGRVTCPEPNPFSCLMQQGLLLEFWNDEPSSLWTPWGRVVLVGGGSYPGSLQARNTAWKAVRAAILQVVSTIVFKFDMRDGYDYSLYSIVAVNSEHLPESIKDDSRNSSFSGYYKLVNEVWHGMDAVYKGSSIAVQNKKIEESMARAAVSEVDHELDKGADSLESAPRRNGIVIIPNFRFPKVTLRELLGSYHASFCISGENK